MKYYLASSSCSTLQMYFRSLSDVIDYYSVNDNLVYLKIISISRKDVDIKVLHNPLDFALRHFSLGAKSLVLYLTDKDYYLSGNSDYSFQRYIVIHEMTDLGQK